MDRLIAPNSVPLAQADTAPTTGTPQYATDGNPATNVPATQWPAYAFNTLQDEVYNVIVAAGLTPDRTKWNQLLSAITALIGQPQNNTVAGVVGSVRNLKCSNTAAGTSLTFTVDEVVLESALGGLRYCAANLNASVSTTVTGALGGVVGTALTASGFAGVYVGITATGTVGLFINTAGTATLLPSVAASPPAAVIASALVSVWPLNASTQFVIGYQNDRTLINAPNIVLLNGVTQSSYTSLSLVAAVPANAKIAQGYMAGASTTSGVGCVMNIASDANGLGDQLLQGYLANTSAAKSFSVLLKTAQALFYNATVSSGTGSFQIAITGYTI